MVALAVFLFAICVGAITDGWRPIAHGPGSLAVLVLATPVGLGIALGSWRAVLASFAIVPGLLIAAIGNEGVGSSPLIVIGLVFWGVGLAALIAIGVLLRRGFDRVVPKLRDTVVATGFVLLGIALTASAYCLVREVFAIDVHPEHPELIGEEGSFRGVSIGDPAIESNERLGERCEGDNDAPCGVDASFITGAQTLSGGWHWDNYRDVTYYVSDSGVKGFLVTSEDAETENGAGIGDSLEIAERRYPDTLHCDVEQFEDSTGDPYCAGRLPGGRFVLFGGDPIDSVVVASHPVG